MARHNLIFLLGYVTYSKYHKNPNGSYIMTFVTVARGERSVGDHKTHMKCDNPLIMSRDPNILEKMSNWEANDIVAIKGVIAARGVQKGSICKECGTMNSAEGVIVYINPIYVEKICHLDDQDACLQYLAEHREVSNQAYVLGTLCRDPKKVTPKEGLIVTQYQVALNRKYRIREDPPEIRTDYPWVKSYGDNALSDREHLHVGSEVFIDGCLQARNVNRHIECKNCGTKYDWQDRALELVPYETEYITNYYTEEEIAKRIEQDAANAIRNAFGDAIVQKPDVPDDTLTDDDIRAGIQDKSQA